MQTTLTTEHPTLVFQPIKMNWQSAASILILALEDGSQQGRQAARIEIMRMAKLADLYCSNLKDQTHG
jgi:hypothetical protein